MIRTLLLTAALLAASPLAAQTKGAGSLAFANPEDVMNGFAEEGFLTRLTSDNDGDPKLTGRMSGVNYSVYFYGCDENNCRSLAFYSSFTLSELSRTRALALVNDWNVNKRFGKAYVLDDGDLGFEMNVNMDFGVEPRNLTDTIDWWRIGLDEFLEHINW